MTANTNAITKVITMPITTVVKSVPELLHYLQAFGFRPENMLPYVLLIGGGYILSKAIDSRYTVSANVEHNGNTYQFNLQPDAGMEV